MTGHEIVKATAAAYGCTVAELIGHRRRANIVSARHHAIYLIRRELGWSLPRIAKLIGDRDHTSILHALRKPGFDRLLPDPPPARVAARRGRPPVLRAPASIAPVVEAAASAVEPHNFPPSEFARLCIPAAPSVHESLRALVQHHGWNCYRPFEVAVPTPAPREAIRQDHPREDADLMH